MSQFNATHYEIQRVTGVCASTGRTLEPGEAYYATLCELSEAEFAELEALRKEGKAQGHRFSAADALGIKRVDVSLPAWQEGFRPAQLFSFWKSVVPTENEKKKTFVDDPTLMALVLKLGESEDPGRLAFRHVVSLILLRKKLLRYDGVEVRQVETKHPDGTVQTFEQDWWCFTPKKDVTKGHFGKWDETAAFAVLDPHLDESQVKDVTEQLGEVLDGDF